MSRSWSRRSLLKGLGAFALTLPLLEAQLAHAANAAVTPKRFIVMWTPNGTLPSKWKPIAAPDGGYELSEILAPLAPHKDDVLVIDGVDALSAYQGPGDDHQKGVGHCLTGTELLPGDFLGADGFTSGWAGGISVDQAIADAIGGETKFRSLELGVAVSMNTVNSRISYRGPGRPLAPENDPRQLFDRLFAVPDETAAQKRLRVARRKSVLDVMGKRYQRLLPTLGARDRSKLDAHLTAIREIERQLDFPVGPVCTAPGEPPVLDRFANENIPAIAKLQMDLLVEAMACDLTRVGTLMWMESTTDVSYPWLGVTTGHHLLVHRGLDDADVQTQVTSICAWYASQFAYLIEKLKAVPEGAGTLLDNTFVIWVTEHSRGDVHERHDLPYVAAGRAGGSVKPGRWLQFSGDVPHNNLWLACLQMFGVPAKTFGNPAYCTGPLSGLAG